MKKNGFTLVEILAVLVLISAIAIISIPSILNYINREKNNISEVTKKLIFSGVDLYIDNNKSNFKENKYEQYIVSLQDVVDQGFLTEPIIDSVSGKEIDLTKKVQINYRYDNDLQKFTSHYEIVDESTAKTFICVMTKSLNKDGVGYGDEYICDLGDGEDRKFFLLEDGDNTGLSKSDSTYHTDVNKIGTADKGELALFMNQMIGDKTTVAWCEDENRCKKDSKWTNEFGPLTALDYLKQHTSNWNIKAKVSLPTYWQIKQANGGNDNNLPLWLYDNLDTANPPYGYWTATASGPEVSVNKAFLVISTGILGEKYNVNKNQYYCVHPVITISKNDVYSY